MKNWLELPPLMIAPEFQVAVGGHPLVARTLVRRGLAVPDAALAYLDPHRYTPAPPADLPGLAAAAEIIEQAIQQSKTICVWGDFDVDGQTATAILVQTLRDLGGQVTYHIPVRARESHGVSVAVLAQVIEAGAELVLTCDTGIAAHAAVDYAHERGVPVVITDHHDLPPTLPAAQAIASPRLLPPGLDGRPHPLAGLPGAGVAYKLAEELYRRAGQPELAQAHLDLAALGIVADLALLTGDTRYLLQTGLEALRRTTRPGLLALMRQAELNPATLTEEDLAFMLAPRLNAVGRLADANPVVEFLITPDPAHTQAMALNLESLNARRKLLTRQVYGGAVAQIEADPTLLDHAALVLANPAWPAGVIGIVASRLVERYGRPVVLLATPAGENGRGSARSVEGVHITEAIAACADLLEGFGGHPMAAGLSLPSENLPAFRRRLSQAVVRQTGTVATLPDLEIDGRVALAELTPELVADLARLAPFGPGNPPLTLATPDLRLKSHSFLGREEEHLVLVVEDQAGESRRVVWWNGGDTLRTAGLPETPFDLAYTARLGRFGIQLEWLDFRPAAAPTLEGVSTSPARTITDHRGQAHPAALLQALRAQGEILVWGEGEGREKLGAAGRNALSPCQRLVIWTTPPGRAELQAALARVKPRTVYLFAVDPRTGTLEAFLTRLGGLVKFALRAGPAQISLAGLAAATAQREVTVGKGLAWLQAHGDLSDLRLEAGEAFFAPGTGISLPELPALSASLQRLLAETAAFRAYFSQASPERVLE